MRILQVCAEMFPLLKTGGLADVTGALPAALGQVGEEVRTLLPAFPALLATVEIRGEVAQLDGLGTPCRLLFGETAAGLPVYLLDAPHYYDRPGNPYQAANGEAYADNAERFALLSWAAAQLAQGVDPLWQPQLVHAHDWHAALTPAYLAAAGRSVPCIYTIHNLAYQGVFAAETFARLQLPAEFFAVDGLEYYGQLSFMKAGIVYADRVTTVSPSYAQEITTAEQGCGLDGLLRSRAAVLAGVLNGVDPAVWHPATDTALVANYSVDKPAGKAKCKAALQAQLGLNVQDDAPLFVVVSRLTEQKGLQLVLAALPEITARGGQLAVLGSGDTALEEAFVAAAQANPTQVAVKIGYDETFSHQLIAGGDVIMVPSRFEPCGLTQLYGLQYGTLPLVRRVGGLADTVVDCSLENLAEGIATGFSFDGFSSQELTRGIKRAFALWARSKEWKQVRKTAMQQNFGWSAAADQYQALYQQVSA
ncbi:glycogen synthase GlgA [Chitinibacter tainanensis]|uniref:glycogen synthase GlgA n=1 Tax=Chitinibacter tainanensis TaxID=230667 RepID=UPI002352EA94|nr:glycogen synthase GlgA [Chitinibacter tainanensis]